MTNTTIIYDLIREAGEVGAVNISLWIIANSPYWAEKGYDYTRATVDAVLDKQASIQAASV